MTVLATVIMCILCDRACAYTIQILSLCSHNSPMQFDH